MPDSPKSYSIPALKRLPVYLHELQRRRQDGETLVSSPALAKALSLEAIQVRKDLELVGAAGSPGVGYAIEELVGGIERFLGWQNSSEAFLVGVDGLGGAIAGYSGFEAYKVKIIAAFSLTPGESERMLCDIPVFDFAEFRHLAGRLRIKLAVLCVPPEQAQPVAEQLVDCGILAIWNLTARQLKLPERIILQNLNLAGDLAVLSVKLAERLRADGGKMEF